MATTKNELENTPAKVQNFVKKVCKLIGEPNAIRVSLRGRFVGMYWEFSTKEKYKTFSVVCDWCVCESGNVLTRNWSKTHITTYSKRGLPKDMRNIDVLSIDSPAHAKREFDRY